MPTNGFRIDLWMTARLCTAVPGGLRRVGAAPG